MTSSAQYRCLALGRSTVVIAAMLASRNHGNSLNATNVSFEPSRSQNPCLETFVTSTAEVRLPRFADFIAISLDDAHCCLQLRGREPGVASHGDLGLQPDLRLPTPALDVNVRPRLLSREEIEAIPADAKDRWAHDASTSRQATSANVRSLRQPESHLSFAHRF